MRWCDLCRFLKARSGNMSCHNCPYIYLKLNLHYINQHQSNIIFPYAQKSSILMWQLSLFTIINYLDSKIPSYTWSIFFFTFYYLFKERKLSSKICWVIHQHLHCRSKSIWAQPSRIWTMDEKSVFGRRCSS